MQLIKNAIQNLLNLTGYKLVRLKVKAIEPVIAVELTDEEMDMVNSITDGKYGKLTMVSKQRLVATLKSCKYVVENVIPGDFVECGVWRGGNSILAKKVFEHLGSDKRVVMFDNFTGMTEPTEFDIEVKTRQQAKQMYRYSQQGRQNAQRHHPSLEDVKNNCLNAGVDISGMHFVKGDVCHTLDIAENLPSRISVLRLDTDWYESTKKELNILYPIVSRGGVLLIDDYGFWEGSRKAVDEYFAEAERKPLLNVTDCSGRAAIKI